MDAEWIVDQKKTLQLNLRQGPFPANVIAILPAGTPVEKIAVHRSRKSWWLVNASPSGTKIRGFVNFDFLAAKDTSDEFDANLTFTLPPSHLPAKGHRRQDDFGRCYPLDEVNMPLGPPVSAQHLLQVARYLEPENKTHKRYQPGPNRTYANIFAYDFCHLCGAFLPRVWWSPKAKTQLQMGRNIAVNYGQSVYDLNTNALGDWLLEYGQGFGWRRVFCTNALQAAANQGKPALIIGKRRDASRCGHMTIVLPEHEGHSAARGSCDTDCNGSASVTSEGGSKGTGKGSSKGTGMGKVQRPVQAQAGGVNFNAKTLATRWWLHRRFQSFSFWLHETP